MNQAIHMDSPRKGDDSGEFKNQGHMDIYQGHKERVDLSLTNSIYSNEPADNASRPNSIFERSKINHAEMDIEYQHRGRADRGPPRFRKGQKPRRQYGHPKGGYYPPTGPFNGGFEQPPGFNDRGKCEPMNVNYMHETPRSRQE